MSSPPPSSMGTFSVRNLRADIQNVTARPSRTLPSLMRFITCYLFLCLAFYLYFRYYLTDERDYITPRPAAVIHEHSYRPLKTFSSSHVAGTAKELFKRLKGKFRSHGTPRIVSQMNSYGRHRSADDIFARLEEASFKDENKLRSPYKFIERSPYKVINRSPYKVIKVGRPKTALLPTFRDVHFPKILNISGRERESISEQNITLKTKNLTRSYTNEANITTVPESRNFNISLIQVIPITEEIQTSSIPRRLRDFRREWLRQRRARVDWQSIMRPCVDNMAWGLVKQDWGKLNRSSVTNSDVIYWDIRPAGEFSKVFIQSKTADNRTKAIGGDTWRVYLRGPASIAATVFDHNNGSYEALFLVTEPGVYQLEMYLDYSLCDGFRDPPHGWFIIGNAQGKYQKHGLLGTLDDYLYQPIKNRDPLIITVPASQLNTSLVGKLKGLNSCSGTCKHLWDGFGRWVEEEWRPYLKESYKWRVPFGHQPSGTLWIYGDSLAVRFHQSVGKRPLCGGLYSRCQHSYNWIYPVQNEAVSKVEDDDLDFRPEKVIETIVDVLRRLDMQEEGSTLLLNLGIHFPIGLNFTTYQKLIDSVINVLKETEVNSTVPKYKAKVIWKTSTAIHKENGKDTNLTNWRFFTTQRVALFNSYAMSAMCKAGFDVIDVYPLTDSYPNGTLDSVHYKDSVFSTMEKMLEKYKVHNNIRLGRNKLKRRIKRCIS